MKNGLLFFLLLCFVQVNAQDVWDLRRAVEYALANNISVKQADVQARITALQTALAEAGRYPSLNLSGNAGYNLGRSVNPATNSFENRNIFFSGFQLQSGVTLFNWFSQRYNREATRLEGEAANAATDRARNDVALNVAVAYLNALLSAEQINISKVQVSQTSAQLEVVRKQVRAGTVPELNAAEIEAQLARDTANFITAQGTYQQNLINLKALLNLDMATPFEIEKPAVAAIPVESLAELQPDVVYQEALKNLPQQRVNSLRYAAAEQSIKAARAARYPTLGGFASIGTNSASGFADQRTVRSVPTGKFDTVAVVPVNNINYFAVRPGQTFVFDNASFGQQIFNINPRQSIGINLSVPIFNNRQLRTAWERSKLNAEGIRLQMNADNLRLQQDIYTAYTNAVNAVQRYNAAQKAVRTAEIAYDFSQKRFNAGLLQTLQLLINQNNLFRARLDAVSAQYEYVFRLKLLEFYKGRGLKL